MPDSLAMCLRPYEQLVPGCNLESEIRQAVGRYERVGLVGGIGCGKSGVSRYALGGPGLGMIALNVVTEDREKIATVRGFLEILVAQLLSRATAASRREIAEQLECGLVIAIHDRYREREDYAGFTAGRIATKEIPRLTEPGQLAQIIDRRGEFADPAVTCGELLTEAGLRRLPAIHMSERVGGLRATLGVFHQALGLAISDASESIDERHVTAADTIAGG
jgi:hypothetical protein